MTKATRPAPIKNQVDMKTKNQGITEPWRKWFSTVSWDVDQKVNKVSGATAGHIAILTSTGDIADGGVGLDKIRSTTYTITTILTTAAFGRVIKFDSPNDLICYLPSVVAAQVDSWLTIMRLGTGMLTIQAADADTIEKSAAGGKIRCKEAGRVAANLTLFLATETKWAILGGTGIWEVY
jgi:hypothetical protein